MFGLTMINCTIHCEAFLGWFLVLPLCVSWTNKMSEVYLWHKFASKTSFHRENPSIFKEINTNCLKKNAVRMQSF